MTGPFKVAAVQAAPVFMDLDATIAKAVDLIDEAGAKGVKLIAFPETWVPGYPWWIWLDAPAMGLGNMVPYSMNSLVAGSPQDMLLAEAAKRNGIQVVMGLSEKIGGSLFMSQWHYGADGETISRRRKLKPTHVERTVFGEGDGSDMAVKDTPLGRVGALCCWEHLQPLSKYAMYAQNEQIHVAAWPSFSLYLGAAYALGPELNTAASQMYAAEGQCFVLAACATVSQAMVDFMCDTPVKQQFLQVGGGHANIFGPDGAPLLPFMDPTAEGLQIAEIDLAAIAVAKAAADPAGHYSRPDVFRLMFNDKPAPRVMSFADGSAAVAEAEEAAAAAQIAAVSHAAE
ncbi:carbon-nitrogen hydrolase family protein [Chachezhania sediminis]|uniref:carbon-nitrogen hydrolase family protein n=1 Tax=Chachezhania sediminis TaxID=2599291 RepID=UPI00131B87B9|nr:carbon-nitrogen hydrolase family protein [Chachezhania sediminis]